MTPLPLATEIVDQLVINIGTKVLEPSFGTGNFLLPLIERFMSLHTGSQSERLHKVLKQNVFGTEIDNGMYVTALESIKLRFGDLPLDHNLTCEDFFVADWGMDRFDVIVGNPPYGGTFDPDIEFKLDKKYGFWNGFKIKKETYSFFMAKSLELLEPQGSMSFVLSDSFLTINTMQGLRRMLCSYGGITVNRVPVFSDETTQPTVVLNLDRSRPADHVTIDGYALDIRSISQTGNYSWGLVEGLAKYFGDRTLGDYVVATSGMTVGNNELFVRSLEGNEFIEPYQFRFEQEKITLEGEISRARLHIMSESKKSLVRDKEASGATRRVVRVVPRANGPIKLEMPHVDYRYYNKSNSEIVYAKPTYVIYWADDGDAVVTYKKSGPWYLHGVGGQRFFGRTGLTWSLVSSGINMKLLPDGYILDSGAPCAFLRDGVDPVELWFILAWTLTEVATEIMKTVINHTRNIQGKDLERLPYPFWVSDENKQAICLAMETLVTRAMRGERFDRRSPELLQIEKWFRFN